MPMTATLFSLSGASVELNKDRRILARVLRSVPPDGTISGPQGLAPEHHTRGAAHR
jgi:hypothetical protein